jgi:FlaA1/EpsC-like NDP-sugar epimerase
MLGERVSALRRLHLACDLILTCLAFVAAGALDSVFHYGLHARIPASFSSSQDFIVICAIWGIMIYRQKQSYIYRTKPVSGILRNVLNVVVPGTLLFVFWLFATKTLFYDRFFFLVFAAIDSALLIGLRMAVLGMLHYHRKSGFNNQNVIVVGTGDLAKSVVDDLKAHPEWGFRVIGLLDWQEMTKLWRYQDIPLIGSLSHLPDLIRDNQVDYVVFAVPHDQLNRVDSSLMICEEMGTKACLMADFFSTNIAKKEITEFLGRPVIVYNTTPDYKFQITIKNVVDRVGATLGLLVVSPIMVAVAALVKLTSQGPMFFKQERCGINGKREAVQGFQVQNYGA